MISILTILIKRLKGNALVRARLLGTRCAMVACAVRLSRHAPDVECLRSHLVVNVLIINQRMNNVSPPVNLFFQKCSKGKCSHLGVVLLVFRGFGLLHQCGREGA